MAMKAFLIAAFVIAVTANAVRLAHHKDDSHQHKTEYEPIKTNYEPMETDYEPIETDYEPIETNYEPIETDYEPIKTGYEPIKTDYESIETNYELKKTDYEPIETVYEPKKTDFEPIKIDYESLKSDYVPKKTDYKIKSIICVGVDVTNDCINRADGNYAIDNKPRSGYVACVNKRPICLPCPYGLVFCAKAGYRKLGQCLGRYDECPPRRF